MEESAFKSYSVVVDFLVSNGRPIHSVKDNSFKCFQYKDSFCDITFGEYMNGQGSYIRSENLFIIFYKKTDLLVIKEGNEDGLLSLAERFVPVGEIKKLFHYKL